MICSGDGFAGHVNRHGACVGVSASMGGPHHTGRRRCKSVSLMSKHQIENHEWFQSMLHRDIHWRISIPSQSHHLISQHLSLIVIRMGDDHARVHQDQLCHTRVGSTRDEPSSLRQTPHATRTHAHTDRVVGALMHTLGGPTHVFENHTYAFIPTWIGHAHTRRYRVKIMIQH